MPGEEYEKARDFEPVKGEPLPKGRGLKHTELVALFQACNDSTVLGARNAAVLGLLYACGLRRSELVSLSLGDWREADCSLKVKGKGRRERMVYVNNGALDALQDWLKVRGDGKPADPLFVSFEDFNGSALSDRRMNSQTVYHALNAMALKAGVEPFSPHDLRRSYISDLLKAGADLALVSKLAGHALVQTTARYDRRGEDAKAKASTLLKVPYRRN